MKNLKKHISEILLAVLVTGLFSCEKKDDIVVKDSIDKVLSSDANYSIFNDLLAKTKLDVFSKGGGPFTIYAPSNAAFINEGYTSANGFNGLDSATLNSLAAYHIQAGERTYPEIIQGAMTTVSGFSLYGTRLSSGTAFVNGANIQGTGTSCSNGVLFQIDKLLLPAFSNSIVANVLNNNNGKLMLQAAAKTGVTLTTNPYTIFAIPNTTMIAEGYDSTTIANLVTASVNYNKLQSIIRYHIVAQRSFSSDLKAGSLKSVQGSNFNVAINAGNIELKGVNNPTSFSLGKSNIITTTGVVHVINGMLKP